VSAGRIGPSFGEELAQAGLRGIPISWSADGQIIGRETLPRDQQRTLDKVLAAHDPEARPAALDAAYIDEHVHTIEDVRALLKMMLQGLPPIRR